MNKSYLISYSCLKLSIFNNLQRRHSASSLQGSEREKNDEERREVAQLEERIDRLFYDFGSDSESTRQHIFFRIVPDQISKKD